MQLTIKPVAKAKKQDMRTYSFRITEADRVLLDSMGGGDFLRDILSQVRAQKKAGK